MNIYILILNLLPLNFPHTCDLKINLLPLVQPYDLHAFNRMDRGSGGTINK